jgi:EAL domain-containing protein (putative c-di-GMP-specific phosphodiesterase class I)/CHASE2 domain-containing sensor protein
MHGRQLGRKTRAVLKRAFQKGEMPTVRLLMWTAIVVVLLTLVGVTQPFEDLLRMARNNFHPQRTSGDVVLISIDDRSLHDIGRWPWPRRYHAQLIDRLTAAGVKQIYSDITFETRSTAADDDALADAIKRSGHVTLPVRGRSGPFVLGQQSRAPMAMFSRYSNLGSIAISYNFQNAVWHLPYSVDADGRRLPSYAASMAGVPLQEGQFPIDYSYELASVPVLNAADVISGKFNRKSVVGKNVIIGANSETIGDQYYIPGVGKTGGVYIQILGAETLKAGKPLDLGWVPAFVLALGLTAFGAFRKRQFQRNVLFAGGLVGLSAGPLLLESWLVFVDVVPALAMLTTIWAVLGWRNMKKRGLVNPISGLPNLSALRASGSARDQAIIACRVLNYEEVLASLPPEGERQLVDQIVARLKVGNPSRLLYQGDAGIFVWFEDAKLPFSHHIEALASLFRKAARVGGLPIDLAVTFGVEIGSSRSLQNRLASALVAAEEAAHDGLKWKYHDPDTLQDASWKLSMLSELDAAIDRNEVGVAYQPKLDIITRKIIGAEALARWTHPVKGPIAASEFVAAAEQHDRIGKLTDFVLEKAVAAAAALNKRGDHFEMAVNLSARLLTDKGLTLRVAALLARHSLRPDLLTLELTETAALADDGESLEMITRLREIGVRISIDDYGTGLSTLDYLKKIPANEIKIDQSFVKGMVDNRSDRLMVQSTIGLAHSLGRKVVAEGVEQREILDLLTEMECDIAQGFSIGRPMSLDSLNKRLASDRKRNVA